MDITTLFKACVKTVKTRNKALGIGSDAERSTSFSSALKKSPKSEFASKAKEIVSNISKMLEFLMQHRRDYININYIMYEASNMSDGERDQIEKDVQAFIKACNDVVRNLKNDTKTNHLSIQAVDHREAVIEILETYLKAVCKIFTEQKAIRVKRMIEKQKLDRLETAIRNVNRSARESPPTIDLSPLPSEKRSSNTKENTFARVEEQESKNESFDSEFSPREIELFEQENIRLYDELNTMVDEVRAIEGKVVEISRLQEAFTDKVLQQEQEIEKVSDVVVGTTENIKDGNEELREAMRKKAGMRIWIMFFLLVLSFSLLFLDWYNP